MNNDDLRGLMALLRRSRYDVLQAHLGDRWSFPLSFTPCSPRSAEQATLMLRRMYGNNIGVRHARRARLRSQRASAVEVAVITLLPDRQQVILRLHDDVVVRCVEYLTDKSLQAIEATVVSAKTTDRAAIVSGAAPINPKC